MEAIKNLILEFLGHIQDALMALLNAFLDKELPTEDPSEEVTGD